MCIRNRFVIFCFLLSSALQGLPMEPPTRWRTLWRATTWFFNADSPQPWRTPAPHYTGSGDDLCDSHPTPSIHPSVLVLILCLARNINDQHDNVAIGEKPFSTGYTWVTQPELGFVLTNSCHQLTPTVIFCQPWNESQTAFFFAFDEVSSLQLHPHHFYPPCWWLTLKRIFASLLISLFLGDEGKWEEE